MIIQSLLLSARLNSHQLLCTGNILKYIYSIFIRNSHQLLCTGNILKNFRTHDDTNCYKSGSGVSFKSDIIIIKHKRVKVSCCQLCALTSSLCNLTFHIPDGNNLPMFLFTNVLILQNVSRDDHRRAMAQIQKAVFDRFPNCTCKALTYFPLAIYFISWNAVLELTVRETSSCRHFCNLLVGDVAVLRQMSSQYEVCTF